MRSNDEETLWIQGSPLIDDASDLAATPCPVPVQRLEHQPVSVASDSLALDSLAPDLLTPESPAPAPGSPALPDTLSISPPALPASPALDSSAPAPDSQALLDTNLLIELDVQHRHEERAVHLMEDYAAAQLNEEDKRAERERLQEAVKAYEQISSDEETVFRSPASEDCRPQELYCVQRARYLNKRRSSFERHYEYPVKRGGDSSDALVIIKYPGIDTEISVRRFGFEEVDARHGKLSEFRRAWLNDYHADQRGYHGDGNAMLGIHMFYVDHIYRAQLPVVYEELYYVDLFFRSKFYASFGKRRFSSAPKPLYIAWCNFVCKYVDVNSRDPNVYEMQIQEREERFYNKSVAGVAVKIHALSLKMGLSCTVPVDVECPSCYSDSSRAVIGAQPHSDLAVLHTRLRDINKQVQATISEPIDHGVSCPLEDAVTKLRADVDKPTNPS